jgi:L-lactate dehydrogenase complex protein LldG
MGGRFYRSSEIFSPLAWIREHISHAKIICSAVPEVPSDRPWSAVRKPQDLADVDVAVVRAVLGVAESGSVLFTEAELKVNTLAYLAQHLVVLLDQSAIVSGLQDAYTRPGIPDRPLRGISYGPVGYRGYRRRIDTRRPRCVLTDGNHRRLSVRDGWPNAGTASGCCDT